MIIFSFIQGLGPEAKVMDADKNCGGRTADDG